MIRPIAATVAGALIGPLLIGVGAWIAWRGPVPWELLASIGIAATITIACIAVVLLAPTGTPVMPWFFAGGTTPFALIGAILAVVGDGETPAVVGPAVLLAWLATAMAWTVAIRSLKHRSPPPQTS